MTMSKEKLLEVCAMHKDLFTDLTNVDWTADEIFSFLDFASDVLHHESVALEEKEPYATKCIDRLRAVAYDIYELGDESYEVLRGEE